MLHDNGMDEKPGLDFKAAGYIVSILSVFFLGAVAWPKAGDPEWIAPALVGGMILSIVGMGLRYVAHLKQQKEIKRAEAEARQQR